MPLGRGLSSLIPSFKQTAMAEKPVSRVTANDAKIDKDDKNRLWQIPLSLIRPNPHQPRRNFGHADLEELVNSIKEKGIIQPLLVSEVEDGNYELIAGERRWRSAEILGLPTVPAIIRVASDSEKLELALIENIQRKELNPIEEAFAYERLTDEFGLTHDEIGKRVGKSRPHVSNMMRLLTLPTEIQKGISDGLMNFTVARSLLGLNSVKDQVKMYHRLLKERKTTREVGDEVAHERFREGHLTRRDPFIMEYEGKLRDLLSTRVRITRRGEKGTILIEFFSEEEMKKIFKMLLR